ncbi:hypothetical protein C6361_22250 [Plantactinospora sp. BC1]|nr:hypothetical protein C6361_22250 [Plantactinospora sp. BC1]
MIRGGGLAVAGLAGVTGAGMFDPEPASAAAVGPWEYVAPGGSIQAAISAGATAVQLGAGRYTIAAPVWPAGVRTPRPR